MSLTWVRTLSPTRYWNDDAACKGQDLSLFYGSDEMPLTGLAAKKGRRVCLTCPVARDCLLDALLTGERMGLRAGFLGHERAHTLRRLGGDVAAAMADYDAGVFFQNRRT
jgi:WhiB family redox-sensing transcriptional regulator